MDLKSTPQKLHKNKSQNIKEPKQIVESLYSIAIKFSSFKISNYSKIDINAPPHPHPHPHPHTKLGKQIH